MTAGARKQGRQPIFLRYSAAGADLFLVPRAVGDVALAVYAEDCAVRVDHSDRVVVRLPGPLEKAVERETPERRSRSVSGERTLRRAALRTPAPRCRSRVVSGELTRRKAALRARAPARLTGRTTRSSFASACILRRPGMSGGSAVSPLAGKSSGVCTPCDHCALFDFGRELEERGILLLPYVHRFEQLGREGCGGECLPELSFPVRRVWGCSGA